MYRVLTVALLSALASQSMAQQGDGTDVPAQVHTFKPDKVEASASRISSLKVPEGFQVAPLATGLKNARIIAVAPGGYIYVSRRDQGDVLLLKDANDDGQLDAPARVVVNRPSAHGLAVHGGQLYLATVKEIFVASIQSDGSLGPLKLLVGDLPDGGQHPNRTMAFGPDDMLYVSIGSSCNACNETNPEHAALLRLSPDGKSRTIFASGLRNTIGFDWEPSTGELWGMDQGIDFLGDQVQPEELNHIVKGKQYGWPHIWGTDGVNPQSTPPGEITKKQWADMSEPMVMGYSAHAAAMQFHFYRGSSFPSDYRGSAFITFRGSWNRKPASGYEVVRLKFEQGKPVSFEPFVTGFLTDKGTKHFARPVGLAETSGGALLVSDDANGVIYRISAKGAAPSSASVPLDPAPASAMEQQVNKGNGVPLALARPETKARGSIKVTADGFQAGGPMDKRFSDYADGVSPALSWTPVSGAKSYVVIVEDPDAKPITPFVHWVAWNIPSTISQLPEGLQEQPRLTEPEGLLQGATSRGSVGYYGPHPPVGDPPHHYHFQVLALDSLLSAIKPGATRDEVIAAASGHVIAKGEVIGTYTQAVQPPK